MKTRKLKFIVMFVFILSLVSVNADAQRSRTNSNTRTKQTIQTFTVKGVSFRMVSVEGGTFTMGATSEQGSDADDWEKPAHRVTLSSFSIGETEVTQELWAAVMGSNPSKNVGKRLPVEQVRWNDCQEFISKLNSLTGKSFRLPTEAEWEYAARGGNKSHGYKYSGRNNIDDVAWYNDNCAVMSFSDFFSTVEKRVTHDVATKSPNELGIYDMSGNVMEWCSDRYGKYSSNSQTNPQGHSSDSFRIIRGGSWSSDARDCRVSSRHSYVPSDFSYQFGLRLAL